LKAYPSADFISNFRAKRTIFYTTKKEKFALMVIKKKGVHKRMRLRPCGEKRLVYAARREPPRWITRFI